MLVRESRQYQGFLSDFCAWLSGSQYVVLGVWSAGTCGQAVARERELKTFDFLKTTRLSPGEILVGKLLGAPIVAYFMVACTLPLSIVAGLLGGIRPAAVLWTIILLPVFNLFYRLVAFWGSMLFEKSSSGAIGLLGLTANLLFAAFAGSPFPGFATISVFPTRFSLHGVNIDIALISPTVFGVRVPCAVLSLPLYVLLGAWFVLMIVRNLKRDLPQIQLLSRWQCVGLVAFWNLLFYAFLDTRMIKIPIVTASHSGSLYPFELTTLAVAWNSFFLFLIGVAALSPHEKLKVWWRRWKAGEASYFASNGLPWPWLVPSAAIAYGMLAAVAGGLRSAIPLGEWRLGSAALVLAAFLVFTARDVLFLQWCLLTRMKHPVMKGVLFLVLYYSAVGMVGFVVSSIAVSTSPKVMSLLTAYALLGEIATPPSSWEIPLLAIALQVGMFGLILVAIQRRLARPVHYGVAQAA